MSAAPQVSIATSFCYDLPLAEQLPLVAAAGFTHVSLGVRADHRAPLMAGGAAAFRRRLADHGLAVDTLHGKSLEESNSFRSARNTAELAAELGAPTVVLHPGPADFPAADLEGHLEYLLLTCETLAEVSARVGVRFALENLSPGPPTRLAVRALEALDERFFGLCYDSSNDQAGGPRGFELLERLAGRLAAVHLSDRSGPDEDHLLPGEGFIDWEQLTAALRRAGYNRPVLVESRMAGSRFTEPEAFLREAYRAGERVWRAIH